MFLSSGLLTVEERRLAFAAVPEFPALLRNRAIAATFVSPTALDQLDAYVGGFAREAFAAHSDGMYLLIRAAGQIAESRAAELFCTRHKPDGWVGTAEARDDPEAEVRLRRSLSTIPLEVAAMYLDAALNHSANAVVRFAHEAGFADLKMLGLDVDQPVTERWTSWRQVAQGLTDLSQRGSDLPRFTPARAFSACSQDPDLRQAIEYRDNLVHRGVPVDLATLAVKRPTAHVGGQITISYPLEEPPQPQVEATRETMARALRVCRELGDAVNRFLPVWANHLGFKVQIGRAGVGFEWTFKAGRIVLPATVMHLPTGPQVTVPLHGRATIRPHAERDSSLFTSTPESRSDP